MSCTYIKRDAKVCGAAGYNGSDVCYYHRNSIPYVLCETGCGRVVSTKHGRPKCCKCDPKEAIRDARERRKEAKNSPTDSGPEPAPKPEPPPEPDMAGMGRAMEDAMVEYVLNVVLPRRISVERHAVAGVSGDR